MLVYPTLHYQNGGININGVHRNGLPGFFAAGEVIGGVHGENRLMGNSLQDILTFGRRAGKRAARVCCRAVWTLKDLSLDHMWRSIESELAEAGIENPAVAPIILPDYSTDEVAERRWPEALTAGTPGV